MRDRVPRKFCVEHASLCARRCGALVDYDACSVGRSAGYEPAQGARSVHAPAAKGAIRAKWSTIT